MMQAGDPRVLTLRRERAQTKEDLMSAAQAQTNPAADEATKEKGPSPFLRGVQGGKAVLVLWAHEEGSKTHMHGYVELGGKRETVNGFFNANGDGSKFISLSKFVDGADGEKGSWQAIGKGNPLNSDKRPDHPVYFDTVIFNIGDQTIGARTTKAADAVREKLGFTSPRIDRPRAAEAEAGEADAGETHTAAAERPRG